MSLLFLAPFPLSVLLLLLNEYLLDIQRRERDAQVNQRACTAFTKINLAFKSAAAAAAGSLRKDFPLQNKELPLLTTTSWGSLEVRNHSPCEQHLPPLTLESVKVGDVVLLKLGEISPADLVVLDTKDEYACIDVSGISGSTSTLIKHPFHLTESKWK